MTTVDRRASCALTLLAWSIGACGSDRPNDLSDSGDSSQTDDSGVSPGGRDGGPLTDGQAAVNDGASSMIPVNMGAVDPGAPPNTGLPPVGRLTNVVASAIGDSVSITFDPEENAADYRVYELADAADVSATDDGHVTIKNAVYRCAGSRQAPGVPMDGADQVPGGAVKTLVDGQDVVGFRRTLDQAKLGYVYAEAGAGRSPVYALGEPGERADNLCYFHRWTASRRKQYVTSSATRDMLLGQGFRDDGIAFYVPEQGAAGTSLVYTLAETGDYGAQLYFNLGGEADFRQNETTAFPVLTAQADGTLPLMRVFYQNACGNSHDELVAGSARFEFVRRQGDKAPFAKLHWSGLEKETILVVEALDQGCPYRGLLAPKATPRRVDPTYGTVFEEWITPEDMQANDPNHELFINGQFDDTTPRPIARSFVKISPGAAPELDWSFGFKADDSFGDFVDAPKTPVNCTDHDRTKSPTVDTSFYCAERERFAQRALYGEWWVMFTDSAADTNGRYRLTPNEKATMDEGSYLYVSMEVDSFTTLRRYPQILISDRDIPVQNNLPSGNTLVLQTFDDWPYRYELQVCDHKNWDVNDQCPRFEFYKQLDPDDKDKTVGLAPNVEVGDQVGMDFANRWEIYASTKRAYVFFDGRPYGCANLPSAGTPKGDVTVTFGDVLYHSGVDHLFDFTSRRLQTASLRHFDNLGFKSHVSAPAWDESRIPCTGQLL